ncbi:MAG: DsbA family protein [Minwuia sp.]|nr:DsbA family protein [Minwuia sp.]
MDVICYTDVKSPYAFLAYAETCRLEDAWGKPFIWRHHTLHIDTYLDAVDVRSAHNWRRVKYAYMDARRLANRQGLTLYGPKKIFESRPAGIGMSFADQQGLIRPYLDTGFKRFFQRDLETGDLGVIEGLLKQIGADTAGFAAWYEGEGGRLHDAQRAEAEESGVFGVPSVTVDGELFWGGDRLDLVAEKLGVSG